jgi:hypothetical protein
MATKKAKKAKKGKPDLAIRKLETIKPLVHKKAL